MNRNKILSLFGLAMKAGNIASGGFLVEKAVKTGKSYLVVVAEDASENTRKKFSNMCQYYDVPMRFLGTKEELGRAIGKELRSCLAILDENITKAILRQLEDGKQ